MSEILNASGYPFANNDYREEFEKILSKMIGCYNLMLSNNIRLDNNENSIRDYMLYNYFKQQWFKEQFELTNYLFDPELPENKGRIDIRVIPVNPLINDDAFYIIECKKLDNQNLTGISGLNAEYVKNGICRFVTDYYSSYFGINGMIGFVVEDIDIDKNITHINSFLNQDFTNDRGENVNAKTIQKITPIEISEDFIYSYTSTHQASAQNKLVLYHLIFDFSKNIL